MSTCAFHHIVLFVCKRSPLITQAFDTVSQQLAAWGCTVWLDTYTKTLFPQSPLPVVTDDAMGHLSLIIVIGGDGSMLKAAPLASQYNIPLLGINGGRTGFLTDIHAAIPHAIEPIIQGAYTAESRLQLRCHTRQDGAITDYGNALNEVALLQGNMHKMLDFDLYINEKHVSTQRADGLIIATPTGSTAYALSAGGPIIQPSLAVISIVPICAHTLNTKPIIIAPDQPISITLHPTNHSPARLSLDGQNTHEVYPEETIIISQATTSLTILHPLDYDYFHTLQQKLHWEKKPDATNPTY